MKRANILGSAILASSLAMGQDIKHRDIDVKIVDIFLNERLAAELAVRKGNYGEAERICLEVVAKGKNGPSYHRMRLLLGDVLLVQERHYAAVAAWTPPSNFSSARNQNKLWFARAMTDDWEGARDALDGKTWRDFFGRADSAFSRQVPDINTRSGVIVAWGLIYIDRLRGDYGADFRIRILEKLGKHAPGNQLIVARLTSARLDRKIEILNIAAE